MPKVTDAMIDRINEGKATVLEIAEEAGVSRQAVFARMKAYNAGKIAPAKPKKEKAKKTEEEKIASVAEKLESDKQE